MATNEKSPANRGTADRDVSKNGDEPSTTDEGAGRATDRPTAWVDLASPSHPFLFAGLLDDLDVDTRTTVRRKTETVDLSETAGLDATVLGRDFDNTLLRKIGIPLRTAQLFAHAPGADVSLSARNVMCVLASKARGIPSIHFEDNDITAHVDANRYERLYRRLETAATHTVVPAAFETSELVSRGADPASIHTYDGYKEDIYVADFEPDPGFTESLPFDEFVVLRPEALDAEYVTELESLVPDLLRALTEAGINVIYLPRGRGDEAWGEAHPDDSVHVPERALDGLQLAWHAKCTLTGSGTMAREAACMRKPAVSFFPHALLSVDRELVADGRVFHSRSVDDIVGYVQSRSNTDLEPDLATSRAVRAEVVGLVSKLVDRHTEGESKRPSAIRSTLSKLG